MLIRLRRIVIAAAFTIAAATPTPAGAQEPPLTPRVRLHYDLATDLAVSSSLAATLLVFEGFVRPALPVPTCTICDGDDGRVNAVDDAFRSTFNLSKDSAAGPISSVLAYGAAPATGIALSILAPIADRRGDEAPLDVLILVESALTFATVYEGLSTFVPRERPWVHAAEGEERAAALRRRSSVNSFPAGHSGEAFTIAAAAGTVATMRGYRLAPLVWTIGGVLAVATAYLRIASDQHYFTDVATSGALGLAIGIGVPLLFHGPVKDAPRAGVRRWLEGLNLSTSEVAGGRVVSVGRSF